MKSLSTSAEFESQEACITWANEMSKQFNLPMNYMSITCNNRKYDYKTNKYNDLDKPMYSISVTLRAVKNDEEGA